MASGGAVPVLERPDLRARIRSALDAGSLLLIADAGFGKTTSLLGACPRRARVTCRGKIRLVDARRPGRTLASARYIAERGRRSAPVGLRLGKKEACRVRARGVVTTVTRERGVSRKGPRSAINTLLVRRGR